MTPDELHAFLQGLGFVEYLGACTQCGEAALATVNPACRPGPGCLECGAEAMAWVFVSPENIG